MKDDDKQVIESINDNQSVKEDDSTCVDNQENTLNSYINVKVKFGKIKFKKIKLSKKQLTATIIVVVIISIFLVVAQLFLPGFGFYPIRGMARVMYSDVIRTEQRDGHTVTICGERGGMCRPDWQTMSKTRSVFLDDLSSWGIPLMTISCNLADGTIAFYKIYNEDDFIKKTRDPGRYCVRVCVDVSINRDDTINVMMKLQGGTYYYFDIVAP